jgi:hypothetical protein
MAAVWVTTTVALTETLQAAPALAVDPVATALAITAET